LQAESIFNIVRIDLPDWLTIVPYHFFEKLHLRLNIIVASVHSIDCSWFLRRSGACFWSKNSFT